MTNVTGIILAFSAIGAGVIILLSDQWRWTVTGLVIQYLVVFLLISQIWPIGLAAIKLVSGCIAAILLFISRSSSELEDPIFSLRSAQIFRLLAAGLILLIVFAITPVLNTWIPSPVIYLFVGLVLIGMGLIQLGISERPLRGILGLLMLLSGFEVIYSPLEGSALLAAILAFITIILGLIGSYYHVPGKGIEN
jgi:hypothetical protein